LPLIFGVFTAVAECAPTSFREFGCTIDIPAGWQADSAIADEIMLFRENEPETEILIRRFPLEKNYQLHNEAELVEALKGLYSELGMNAEDQSRINYQLREDRAVFNLEFVESDPNFTEMMRKYIEGIIVREEGDGQTMYLMMVRAPMARFDQIRPDALTVFSSFVITIPLSSVLFPRESQFGLVMLFIVIALMAFFFVRNRRIQRSRNPLGKSSANFWRCPSCGLANHIEHDRCNRCGSERLTQHTP